MAKTGPLVGKKITLKPTSGGHQKEACGEIIDETPTRITVRIPERLDVRTFVKATGEPFSARDKDFPRYVAVMSSISDTNTVFTTPEHIMKRLRERANLAPDDKSRDAEFDAMSPIEKLRDVVGWELGDHRWADQIVAWAKDCGFLIASTDAR